MRDALQALLIAADDKMWDDVASEKKRITIRTGHREYSRGAVMLCCHIANRCVMADVTSVQFTTLEEVSLEDIQADGFEDHDDAFRGLQKFYPNIKMDDDVTVIKWKNTRGSLVEERKFMKELIR